MERAQGLVWWDAEQGRWTGHDVPDFIADRPPSYRPPPSATGVDAISGIDPFIMQADGKAWLFAAGRTGGRPAADALRTGGVPVRNPLYGQQRNPVRQIIRDPENPYQPSAGEPGADVFPYVLTTYRLTEHQTAGGMTPARCPYLAELQPALFCEISPQLAAERGVEHGGWVTIITARGAVEAQGAGHRADAAA